MISRIFLVLALLLAGTQGASACVFVPRSLEENVKAAPMIFVGSVRTVENGLAVFTIEKGIKGAKDGTEFELSMKPRSESSCNLEFRAGQRWFYLGADDISGSVMLEDEAGRINAENLAAARKLAPDIAEDGGQIRAGTLTPICALDWGAVSIVLDNGTSATIYADIADIDSPAVLGKNRSFNAGDKPKLGGATILSCPAAPAGQASNLPCRTMSGVINIGNITADDMTGQIITQDGEYHSLDVFHVKRKKDKPSCDTAPAPVHGALDGDPE